MPIKVEPVLINKSWKIAKIISWAIIILGLMISTSGGNIMYLGFFLSFLGIISLIISKIGAWYNDRRAR
jgi:hypothetical protein